MAHMYPTPIDPDTRSDAERLLYDALRDKLSDDYTVFHSVAWQSQDRQGRARDGEADFVIAHRKLGVLVLEAKGGAIRCHPRTRKWTSTDPLGGIHAIGDPFLQAKTSKYVLREQLCAMLGATSWQIHIGHAVAFPDVVVGGELLGPDKPRQITMDATDLADLTGWVEGALHYWRGELKPGAPVLGEAGIQVLVNLLGKAWELRPVLWGEFVREEQELIRLTEQQYQILDVLNRQRRALICGCAGSGKTMLAAEKATRLARQGFQVLLTCYNRNLAADLRHRLGPRSSLDVIHFHELCVRLAQQAGVLPEGQEWDSGFFDYLAPNALLQALGKLEVRYDAVIVDEGQDFQEHWWVPLEKLLRDPESSIFYIFYDDNQRLYVERSDFPVRGEAYLLSVNCRNTQNIHEVVAQFYDAEERPVARGPVGRPVDVIVYDKRQGLLPALLGILHRLTEEERIPAGQIAVLGPLSDKSGLAAEVLARNDLLASHWPPPPDHAFFGSIYSFKGLERPVVVLVELERWVKDLIPLLYTACSRACNHLIVMLPEDAGPEVRDAFAVVSAPA